MNKTDLLMQDNQDLIKYMQELVEGPTNTNEIQYKINHNSVYCWKATIQQVHPSIHHNRIELYFYHDKHINLDLNKIVELLKIKLQRLHKELRSDHIIPTYGYLQYGVFTNYDSTIKLSALFICERFFSEIQFNIIVQKEFDDIIKYIRILEKGVKKRSLSF